MSDAAALPFVEGTDALAFNMLPAGLHENVPNSVYHSRILGVASKGALDEVNRSLARYYAWVTGQRCRDETPALALGKAIHMAILEPELFARTYVIEPYFGDVRAVEGRTTKEQAKENKTRRNAWREEHANATILESADGQATLGMVKRLAGDATAKALFASGSAELTVKWRDPSTGLTCRARPDWWAEDIAVIADVKSTQDAREPAFARSIDAYGYHRQDPFYRRGMAANGRDVENFLFLAIEKEPPHDYSWWELDPEDTFDGGIEIGADLQRLAVALEKNHWPGYDTGVRKIRRPAYARARRVG